MQYFVRRPCVLQTSVEGTVQARRPSRCEAKMCAGNARRSEAAKKTRSSQSRRIYQEQTCEIRSLASCRSSCLSKTDTLSISSCLNEFVAGSEHRLRIFGKFD